MLNAEKFGQELAEIVKREVRPLKARIAALEDELKAGHERLKRLETQHERA